jgi:superfamily I DNA and RNA helicase
MSIEIIYGESRDRMLAAQLAARLQSGEVDGTVYLGYPVLATADDPVYIDALLVSPTHGLVAFQIAEGLPDSDWQPYIDSQDRLYAALESHLGRHTTLRRGRQLAVAIRTATVFPTDISPPTHVEEGSYYCSIGEVTTVVSGLDGLDPDVLIALQAALQRVTTIKPPKRRTEVKREHSRGAILKEIEKHIANLDQWQKQAAIESPDNPQRIRGLAGSGKTIVLALKAAYLHSQQPEWNIAVTFQTRALYQQFEDLITRFCYESTNEPPDFEHLHIIHAWGASGRDGIYKRIAGWVDAPFRDFNYAANTFGRDQAFQGVCQELLLEVLRLKPKPIFDAVLIDEAQDLPPEFFKLVYQMTSEPKRIVWAFDELQNLSESEMPTTHELFGVNPETGQDLVSLAETEGEARRDIVLPVCYRNSPWALATAHAIGFGIYRDDGLVQYFDDADLWQRIGYNIVAGDLRPGSHVELERSARSSPQYFADLLNPDDAVVLKTFDSESDEDTWIAEQIEQNLTIDELEHDDILIVLPDAYTAKRRASRLATILARRDINSHLVGVSSSVDAVFVRDSIAMAQIYRAKGNEAPMVYVLDAQFAVGDTRAVPRRNTIFTAITRSRAWVRICGWGDNMRLVGDEVARVRSNGFRLLFDVPTADELAKMRRIHRDRSDEEVRVLEDAARSLGDLMRLFDTGEITLADLPPRVRTQILRLVTTRDEEGADE